MEWGNYLKISIHWGKTTKQGRNICLDAKFSFVNGGFTEICNYSAGLTGGTLRLRPSSGDIPENECWPQAGWPSASSDPTKEHHIEVIKHPDGYMSWCISHRKERPMSDQIVCIRGIFQHNGFAHVVDWIPTSSVTGRFDVDRHQLGLNVDWTPLQARQKGLNEISEKKRLVMIALLRNTLYKNLDTPAAHILLGPE